MDKDAKLKNLQSRLRRNCTAINKILEEAQEEWPDACLYLDAGGSLHLMSGPTHSGPHQKPRHDRIIAWASLTAAGGDW